MKTANQRNAENTKARLAYNTAKYDIANLLGWFECELAKEPKEMNWATVGTLWRTKEKLIETLSFFSGNKAQMIEDLLGELNNDNVDETFEALRNAPQPDWDAVARDLRRHASTNEELGDNV